MCKYNVRNFSNSINIPYTNISKSVIEILCDEPDYHEGIFCQYH